MSGGGGMFGSILKDPARSAFHDWVTQTGVFSDIYRDMMDLYDLPMDVLTTLEASGNMAAALVKAWRVKRERNDGSV